MIRRAKTSSNQLPLDRPAMSSYVFQFFCGPEGVALANPGGTRARPALAAPPPRAELIFDKQPDSDPRPQVRSSSSPDGLGIETGDTIAIIDTATAVQGRLHATGDRCQATGDGVGLAAVRHTSSRRGQQRLLRTGLRGNGKRRLSCPVQPFQHRPATPPYQHWGMPCPHPRGPPPLQPERPQPPPRPNPCVQQRVRGHERPRTPPKRAPAKPPRPLQHHERNVAPPREPEPPAQVQATELVAKGQQPVEAMFKDVMVASQSDLESYSLGQTLMFMSRMA